MKYYRTSYDFILNKKKILAIRTKILHIFINYITKFEGFIKEKLEFYCYRYFC